MVSQSEKNRMLEFALGLIENTDRYNILKTNSTGDLKTASYIKLIQKPDISEHQKILYLFLHEHKLNNAEYLKICKHLHNQNTYTSDLFFKDGVNFHVRLAHKANRRKQNIFSQYSKIQRDAMINLRELEENAWKMTYKKSKLAYYQPKTDRLEEMVRIYSIQNTKPDHSHTPEYKQGFVEDVHKRMALPTELEQITSDQGMKFEATSTWKVIPHKA